MLIWCRKAVALPNGIIADEREKYIEIQNYHGVKKNLLVVVKNNGNDNDKKYYQQIRQVQILFITRYFYMVDCNYKVM